MQRPSSARSNSERAQAPINCMAGRTGMRTTAPRPRPSGVVWWRTFERSVMSEINITPRRPVSRATSLQVNENVARSRRELRESVVAMIDCHGRSVRSIGRAYGYSDEFVMELYKEGVREAMARIAHREFVRGRLSVMPPVMSMRRAA